MKERKAVPFTETGTQGEERMSKFGRMEGNSVLVMLNVKCLQSTKEEKSSQKCRSGCHKLWKRVRLSRNSKLETASLRGGQGRRIHMKA